MPLSASSNVTDFHDPRREVEKLREHLGSNEGRLAFLVGAGASAAVTGSDKKPLIPTVAALGHDCHQAVASLGEEYGNAFDSIKAECESNLKAEADSVEPPCSPRPVNVEDILSAVRMKLAAIGNGDSIAGLDREGLAEVEKTIRTTIAKAAFPAAERFPDRLPHHDLAAWIGRLGRAKAIELFTTNYDTLFERALEDERLLVFDGFVGSRTPFFSAASVSRQASMPGATWTRLWKIHGSTNWSVRSFADGSERIVRGVETNSGELIFPSLHKYDESRKQPYAAILDHLGRLLDDPSGSLLVVLGYSFGDQHINEIVFDALDARDRTHVFALQFEELDDQHPLIVRSRALPNLLVLGPETAVIGGERCAWRLNEPVSDQTADLMDIAFDSDAASDPEKVATTGRFGLGDFNQFGAFLASLVGDDRP